MTNFILHKSIIHVKVNPFKNHQWILFEWNILGLANIVWSRRCAGFGAAATSAPAFGTTPAGSTAFGAGLSTAPRFGTSLAPGFGTGLSATPAATGFGTGLGLGNTGGFGTGLGTTGFGAGTSSFGLTPKTSTTGLGFAGFGTQQRKQWKRL